MAQIMGKNDVFMPCTYTNSSQSVSRKRPLVSVVGFSYHEFQPMKSSSHALKEFKGQILSFPLELAKFNRGDLCSVYAQMNPYIGKSLRWWEKGLQPNMKKIQSAEDLVDTLLNSGDRLVIVDFFSPGCGGCRALHPKICQIAEGNPEILFLNVNYNEQKTMCHALNVHVLPFFRFYRGAQGRLCSFSCTNATIKKFKAALTKHATQRCSLGPAKGLEESELLSLAVKKDLLFNYTTKLVPSPHGAETSITGLQPPLSPKTTIQAFDMQSLVTAS